jgi:hypothetical protein
MEGNWIAPTKKFIKLKSGCKIYEQYTKSNVFLYTRNILKIEIIVLKYHFL